MNDEDELYEQAVIAARKLKVILHYAEPALNSIGMASLVFLLMWKHYAAAFAVFILFTPDWQDIAGLFRGDKHAA